MAEEKIALEAKLTGVEAVEKQFDGKVNTTLYAVLSTNNVFGLGDDSLVKLTERENQNEPFDKEKLKRAFEKIAENISVNHDGQDVSIEVPSEISKESVEQALKPHFDESIRYYEGFGTQATEGSDEERTYKYYSLYEGSGGFEFANAKVADLVQFRPDIEENHNETFIGIPVAFQEDKWNSIFAGQNKSEPADYIDGTQDLRGLGGYLYKTLQKDDSAFAKQKAESLAKYMKDNADKLTAIGIIQEVGIFSDKSRDAKKFNDDMVVLALSQALDKTKKRHAELASVRGLFKVPGAPEDKIFKTKPLDAFKYKPKRGTNTNWQTIYHPKDVSYLDFKDFLAPLANRGYIGQDEAKEFTALTNGIDITRKLQEIMEKNNLGFQLRLTNLENGRVQNNSSIELVNIIELPTDLVEKSDDEMFAKPIGDTSVSSTEPQSPKAEKADDLFGDSGNATADPFAKDANGSGNVADDPFVNVSDSGNDATVDFDDDDLPF